MFVYSSVKDQIQSREQKLKILRVNVEESNRLPSTVAILNPVQINHAEGGGGNARGSVVIVLVDVQVKGGVAVHIVRPQTRS